MATVVETATSQGLPLNGVDINKFPDGLKTSGQHPPVYSRVRPYADFPKGHTGPTVWKAEDYRENPELWTHRFSDDEIKEIGEAADQFIQKQVPLTGISKVSCFLAVTCSSLTSRADQFPSSNPFAPPGGTAQGLD